MNQNLIPYSLWSRNQIPVRLSLGPGIPGVNNPDAEVLSRLSFSNSSSSSVTTDSKETEKDDLHKTLASRLSPPRMLDSDSEEPESDSDSTDSVESDSGSLPV